MPVEISAEEIFDFDDNEPGSILITPHKGENDVLRFEEAKKRLVERVGRLAEKGCKNTHDKNVQI